jgi:hypothetical protein
MKKLLIHIGYPKAASTTLQNGLFLELHKKNAINFLGRAFESEFYGAWPNKAEYKKWFDNSLDGSANGRIDGALSDHRVNLLSEGWLITHERYHDDISLPGVVKKYFSAGANQTEILVIIRNQADLIPSYYIQNHRRLEHAKFAEYLSYNTERNWTGEGKIFDFANVLREYSDVFGKSRMHVLFFEDLVHNRKRFSSAIGRALDVDPALISASLGERQLNRTMKDGGRLVVRKFDKSSVRYRLFQKLNKLSPTLAGTLRIKVPSVSSEEKETIHQCFKAANLQLAEEFSIDPQIMKEYKYI